MKYSTILEDSFEDYRAQEDVHGLKAKASGKSLTVRRADLKTGKAKPTLSKLLINQNKAINPIIFN